MNNKESLEKKIIITITSERFINDFNKYQVTWNIKERPPFKGFLRISKEKPKTTKNIPEYLISLWSLTSPKTYQGSARILKALSTLPTMILENLQEPLLHPERIPGHSDGISCKKNASTSHPNPSPSPKNPNKSSRIIWHFWPIQRNFRWWNNQKSWKNLSDSPCESWENHWKIWNKPVGSLQRTRKESENKSKAKTKTIHWSLKEVSQVMFTDRSGTDGGFE